MSELQLFNFEGHEVRFVGTVDRPEWVALDIVAILHPQSDPRNRANYLKSIPAKWTHHKKIKMSVGEREVVTLLEPGLYRMLARTNSPIAEPFQDWLFEEVLPAIRKNGGYIRSDATPEQLETLKQTIERQQKQIAVLEQTVSHQRAVIAESSALKTKEDLIAEIQEYCQTECRSQPPSSDKNRMADISVRAAYLLDWLNGAIPAVATLDDILMLWARLKQCGNRLKEFTATTPATFVFDTMKPYDDLINKFERRR